MQTENGARILVVDDNPRNVAILKKILGRSYTVATAASGEEALSSVSAFAPDLILLDIMMPGIDGYETCRRLRARPDLRQTKIIMVSAKAMLSERLEGYEAGADDYVTKPFDEDELLAKIRVYLRLKSVEEVDRLKSELLALLNHETRTPLTFMIAPTEMLLGDPALTQDHKELLQMIHDGAKRLHRLVERVSFLNSLRTNTCKFDMAELDLAAWLRNQVATMAPTAANHGLTLALDCPESAAAWGDAEKLKLVFSALLDNAIRFGAEGKTIDIKLTADEQAVRLTVQDYGPGIDAEILPRIFQEFAVANLQHHSTGHGLSLAAARLIVLRHRGSLVARSEPGQGACFQIDLPAQPPVVQSAAA